MQSYAKAANSCNYFIQNIFGHNTWNFLRFLGNVKTTTIFCKNLAHVCGHSEIPLKISKFLKSLDFLDGFFLSVFLFLLFSFFLFVKSWIGKSNVNNCRNIVSCGNVQHCSHNDNGTPVRKAIYSANSLCDPCVNNGRTNW